MREKSFELSRAVLQSALVIAAVMITLGGCGAVQNANTRTAVKQESVELRAAQAQCKSSMAASELDSIRNKVEVYKDSQDTPAPFEIAANDTVPTEAERAVIAKWAALRDACIKHYYAILVVPPSATPLQRSFAEQDHAFVKEANARYGELIVALYQQKLTYGEFAHKRYEIYHEALTDEAAFRQAGLEKDEQRQMQARQQFSNNLSAWASYMQAVNSRQPQTVNIQGTIQVR
jgi:hypothetical protein